MNVRIVTNQPCEARVVPPSGTRVDWCPERSAIEIDFGGGSLTSTARLCPRHARELLGQLEANLRTIAQTT